MIADGAGRVTLTVQRVTLKASNLDEFHYKMTPVTTSCGYLIPLLNSKEARSAEGTTEPGCSK